MFGDKGTDEEEEGQWPEGSGGRRRSLERDYVASVALPPLQRTLFLFYPSSHPTTCIAFRSAYRLDCALLPTASVSFHCRRCASIIALAPHFAERPPQSPASQTYPTCPSTHLSNPLQASSAILNSSTCLTTTNTKHRVVPHPPTLNKPTTTLVPTTRGALDRRHLRIKWHHINRTRPMVPIMDHLQYSLTISIKTTTKAGTAVRHKEGIMEVPHKVECTTSSNNQWDTMAASADTVEAQEGGFAPDCWERWRAAAASIC